MIQKLKNKLINRPNHLWFNLLILFIISNGFLACSEEEPPQNYDNFVNLIIGDWEYHTQEYSDRGDLPYLVTDCADDRFYRFKSDGTEDRYDYESISSNSSEDYEEDGFMRRKNTCTGDFGLKGSRQYEMIENRIYWTNQDGTESVAKIEYLNEQEFIIQWNSDAEYFTTWRYRVVYHRK